MFKHFAQLFAVVLALLLVASTLGQQQQRTQLYSVNCGGSSFTDENGRQWSNDYNFVNKGRKTLYSPRPVQATASMARLYHSQRWCDDCTSEQPMIYTFPVTSNQVYLVNVHFVEFDATLAGNSFTFTVNGQVNEVNILAETGNMSSIAVVKSMNVTVANSALIELSFVKSANHAKVSAIEVFSFEDVSVDQSTPVVQPDPSDSGDDDTDPPSPNPGPNPNPGPGPSPPSSGSSGDGLYGDGTNATPDYVAGYEKAVHRINCGATQDYTDKKGQIWEKDRDFYGATNIDTWTLPFKYIYAFYPEVQQNYVENTFSDEDSVLYTYERWSSGNWGYKLNAPKKGKYLVRLYFAEWYHGNFELFDWNYRTKGLRGIGVRVFSVNVNGATVLPKVDVFQEVGPFAGLRKEFWVDIAQDNGVIDIAFNKIAESPMCNAIEVIAEADVVPRQRLPSGREGGLLIEYYDYNPGRSSKLGAPEQVASPIAIMPNFDNDVTFVSTITYLNTHATIGNFQDTNYLIQFAAKLHGWLRVPEAGKYKITLESNDGSILEICDDDGLSWNAGQCQTIMNDGNHQNIQITQDFEFTKPGFYRVNLRYFQGHLLTCLRLFWMKEEEFSKFEQYYYVGHSIGQDFLSHDKSQASLVMRSVTPAEGSQNGGTTVTINAFMGLSKNKDNVYVREIHPCLPAPGYKQIKANVIDDKTLTFTTQAACFGMGSLQVVVLDSQGDAVKTTNSLQYFFN